MSSDESPALTENFSDSMPFLPGGLPLFGNYARVDGRLHACRSEVPGTRFPLASGLVLLETGQRPGPDWVLAPEHPGSNHTQWTRTIGWPQAGETFRCVGSAHWRGMEISGLDYLQEGNLVGGYLGSVPTRLEEQLKDMHRLQRVDRSTWHGYVPLDAVEHLRLHREPWPNQPRTRDRGPQPLAARGMAPPTHVQAPAPPERSWPYRAFLPGGMPLHGTYARLGSVLYSARPQRRGGSLSPGERLVLTCIGERPGPDWEWTPIHRGSPHYQWTREIEQSQAQELFRCHGSASWRGVEFASPTYVPAGNYVGGYIHRATRDMEPRLRGIHRLERVDQTTWYGYVPLDGIEGLEIQRGPWADAGPGPARLRPGRARRPQRHPLLARLFGVRPGSGG